MKLSFRHWLCYSSIALILASCSPIVATRGYNEESVDLKQIIAGQSGQEDVSALLGSPTTQSNFGEDIWYYVTQKQERKGMFAPEVTQQHVTAISFDVNKKVSKITEYAKEDGKMVQIVSKTTPNEGHSVTFVEQVLGNLGRFNAPSRGLSQRNRGR